MGIWSSIRERMVSSGTDFSWDDFSDRHVAPPSLFFSSRPQRNGLLKAPLLRQYMAQHYLPFNHRICRLHGALFNGAEADPCWAHSYL